MKHSSSLISNQKDLWSEFLEGSDTAFGLLYETYADSLFDYGLRFVGDADLVKDSIQDLFIKLFDNRHNLSSTDNPQIYLFRAVKNTIINALAKRKYMLYVKDEDLPFYANYEVSDNIYVDGEKIDDNIKEKFNTIINTLSARQKEAIYLRYQQGMSYEEIGNILDVKYQSARNLIHRAISKIRKDLDFNVFLLIFLHTL